MIPSVSSTHRVCHRTGAISATRLAWPHGRTASLLWPGRRSRSDVVPARRFCAAATSVRPNPAAVASKGRDLQQGSALLLLAVVRRRVAGDGAVRLHEGP